MSRRRAPLVEDRMDVGHGAARTRKRLVSESDRFCAHPRLILSRCLSRFSDPNETTDTAVCNALCRSRSTAPDTPSLPRSDGCDCAARHGRRGVAEYRRARARNGGLASKSIVARTPTRSFFRPVTPMTSSRAGEKACSHECPIWMQKLRDGVLFEPKTTTLQRSWFGQNCDAIHSFHSRPRATEGCCREQQVHR